MTVEMIRVLQELTKREMNDLEKVFASSPQAVQEAIIDRKMLLGKILRELEVMLP